MREAPAEVAGRERRGTPAEAAASDREEEPHQREKGGMERRTSKLRDGIDQ
jgi:hypothetical protein